jgi:alkanesulfonate monooxygenase SsuD/methylene tetrahydromethanopterin reductase-like flavin-dependent oxidoreductase (luciferase family)
MQPVRISIIAGPRQRPDLGQTASEAWKLYVEDAIRAEELGFDSAFVGEHHFCFAQGNSSPLVMLAEIAARTERIRIGTSIICLPFHNPLRLAEDIAAVDIVSGGRFDLGVAVGSQWEEFETFGIPPEERFGRSWEAIDIIERCLNGEEEEFTHEGKYFSFPNVRWIIPPVQAKVPIWWGGFGPQGVKRAAERGFNLMAPDYTGVYCETLRSLGRRPEDYLIGFHTMVSVGRTREEAFEAIADPCWYVNEQYGTRRNLDGTWPPPSNRVSVDQLREANDAGRSLPNALFNPVADTVEGVIERLLPMARGALGPMSHFGYEFRPPGTDTAHVRRSMELFAKEVMPVIRDEATKYLSDLSSQALS